MTTDNTAGMAGLEALASATQAIEAENPSPEQQAAQEMAAQQATDAEKGAREWALLMFTVGGFACMIAPELRTIYSQERCLDWGESANAVAEKYGWNGISNMPELALIASTVGFAVPTYIVVSQRLKDLKASKDGTLLEKIAAWWRNRGGKKAPPPTEAAA